MFAHVNVELLEGDDLSSATSMILDGEYKEVNFEKLYDEFIDLDDRLSEYLERKFREKGGRFLQRDGQNVIDLTNGVIPVEDGMVLVPLPTRQG